MNVLSSMKIPDIIVFLLNLDNYIFCGEQSFESDIPHIEDRGVTSDNHLLAYL